MSTTDRSIGRDESPYRAVGEIDGCRKLATAFYARVEHDPVLRPLFPSTFKCAIEGLAMFLTEFLGGPRPGRRGLCRESRPDTAACRPRQENR
jgi:truncated hemoglobin YjbI